MGNICSKSSNKPDNFGTPGRTVGSAPAQSSTAPVPAKVTTKGQGRTLGGGDPSTSPDDARSAAARAAEERLAKANKPGGKLTTQLAAQKKQTQNALLNEASQNERRRRDVDETEQMQKWT